MTTKKKVTQGSNPNLIDSPIGQFAMQAATVKQLNRLAKLLEPRPINNLRIEYVLLPGQGARITEPAPNGIIRTIQISWPDGCNQLVGVAVWCGAKQLIPQSGTGYLALNDITTLYTINFIKTVRSDQILVDMVNQDAANSHHITVVVDIEED